MKVIVKEISFHWSGTILWNEKSGSINWMVIRPDEYSTHTRRGSGSREYSENLIRVPDFLNKVEFV